MAKASEASGSFHVVPLRHRVAAAIGYVVERERAIKVNQSRNRKPSATITTPIRIAAHLSMDSLIAIATPDPITTGIRACACRYMTASIAATLINKTVLGVGKVSPLIIVFLQVRSRHVGRRTLTIVTLSCRS